MDDVWNLFIETGSIQVVYNHK